MVLTSLISLTSAPTDETIIHMKLPKELTKVTPLSKYLAMILFLALPFVGFFLGMQYQELIDLYNRQQVDVYPSTIKRYPTPTPGDETANWKTFINQKLGYEIKYPPDWRLRDEDNSGQLYMLSKTSGFIEFQNELKFDLKPYQTVENYLKSTPGFGGTYKEININGNIGYLDEKGGLEGNGQLYIKHNNKHLSIIYKGFKFSEIDQILSTFNFLN